jgi:predicted NBD/HSP70 family sugar kinase
MYMAIALVNVINTFNPDPVILSAEMTTEGVDVAVERMVTLARTHIHGATARETPIRITSLGKNGNALGAAGLVFQYWR